MKLKPEKEIQQNLVVIDTLLGVIAKPLGWVPPLRYLLRRQRVMKITNKLPREKLLEVGCGAGTLLIELALNKFQCQGLETSPSALKLASKLSKAKGVSLKLHATALTEWHESFDIVCAFDVLEHIKDDIDALNSWKGWVKPGGKLLLSVPAHSKRWGAGDVWAGHYRRYNKSELIKLLTDQGLQIEHFECYGFPLANITEWLGNRSYNKMIEARTTNYAKEKASEESGIQRDAYLKVFHWINSTLGRTALRIAFSIQTLTMNTNFGSGYIVLVSKP